MSKKESIEIFLRQSHSRKQIVEKTGFSKKYVDFVLWRLRHPEAYAAYRRQSRVHRRKSSKTWKKKNPAQRALHRRKIGRVHQEATRQGAVNKNKRWGQNEITYLKKYGRRKTARELALALGRTFYAVRAAGHLFGIDLRGNKTGANALRFRNKPSQ